MGCGMEELSVEELEREGGMPLPDRELMVAIGVNVAVQVLGIPVVGVQADVAVDGLGLLGV
jgi:hypothetical protein